jgi:unsaturated rhamnogalacturonyl hydrolase
MKQLLQILIFLLFTASSFGQFSNTWSVKFADAIRSRWDETPVGGRVCIDKMTSKNWEYSNAIVLHGIEKVYKKVNTAAYRTYIKTYVDDYVNGSGAIAQTINSLDRLHPAILLLFLYEDPATSAADKTRYKTAADFSRNILVGPSATYPKTTVGKIFWHKDNGSYNDIVMLDGFYMAHPFLAKYGRMFNDNAAIDTAVNQTLFIYNQLYDNTTKLIKHAWNPTKTEPWANATTGNSTSVWSRAMGWYMMALVDVLKYVPASHPRRAQLLTALTNLSTGIKNFQDPTSKLWYQVMDKTAATLPGNYLETSGSAMFIYSLKTSIDSGWINSATFSPVAQSAWTGIQTKISTNADGKPQINDFAPAMSVQNTEALYVQASLQGVDCPGTAHPHGYAAILMAASAMEFSGILPVRFASFTAKEFPSKTTLTWKMGDESDVDHYEIQKSTNGNDFITIGTTRAANISAYSFDDNTIENKTVYYRINAVYGNGSPHYSVVLSVRKNNHGHSFEIFPNPVKGGDMNMVATNFKAGKYDVSIIGATGHAVYKETLNIAEGISGQHVQLPAAISKGIYYVLLKGEGVVINKNIIIE